MKAADALPAAIQQLQQQTIIRRDAVQVKADQINPLWVGDVGRHADHLYLRRIQVLPLEAVEYPQAKLEVQDQFFGRLLGLKSERFRFQRLAASGGSDAKHDLMGEKIDAPARLRDQSEAGAVGACAQSLESLERRAGGRSQQVDRSARGLEPDGLNPEGNHGVEPKFTLWGGECRGIYIGILGCAQR